MPQRQQMEGKSLKKFSFLQKLGTGSFGTVYKGVNTKNKQIVAIKAMDIKQMKKNPKFQKLVQSQISILKQVNNQNVIRFVDSFSSSQSVFIVTQFCNGGDLQNYCKKHDKLSQNEALKFLKQILNGFKGLHQKNAMHRDFKLANVLLHNNVCKLADLGFAKQMREKTLTKTVLGTDQTMAPQIHEGKQYGWSADIWSVGVVFYQMLYGKAPYSGANDYQILKNIKMTKPKFEDDNVSQQAVDFIKKCLVIDPKSRISWKQIYDHRLLTRSQLMLTNGQLRSKINIKNNMQFYRASTGDCLVNEQDIKISQQIFKKAGNVQAGDISNAKKIQKNKQQLEAQFTQYQTDLIHQRNNRMFGITQVLILQTRLKQLNISHSRALYEISKNCYVEMKRLRDQVQIENGSYKSLKYWKQFKKENIYKNISEQLFEDQIFAESLAIGYKFDIHQAEFQQHENMNRPTDLAKYKKIISQYRHQLTPFLKDQGRRTKLKFIKMLMALQCMEIQPSYELQKFMRQTEDVKAKQQQERLLRKI